MFDVTTWTTHATREPQPTLLTAMDNRWKSGPGLTGTDCVWHTSQAHALALIHADRATHRRRIRAQYFGEGSCALANEGHGFRPMSDLMPHDQYGPELVDVVHTEDASPLAVAMKVAKSDPNLAAVTVFTEEQFVSVDSYADHSAAHLQPEVHGAVIPFMVMGACDEQRAGDVRDLLHVSGFTTYQIDVTQNPKDPLAMHLDLAMAMEDVFDSIGQIKADAAARILLSNPRWPVVMLCGELDT